MKEREKERMSCNATLWEYAVSADTLYSIVAAAAAKEEEAATRALEQHSLSGSVCSVENQNKPLKATCH